MTNQPRRTVLSVPASEPKKILKAFASAADEVVVDLEDAVAPPDKDAARNNIASLAPRAHGTVAVRVNALDTPWSAADVAACVRNPCIQSLVLPKAEDPANLAALAAELDIWERAEKRDRLRIQALVETATGIHNAVPLAGASDRLISVILGYADLSASMGRRSESSWQFAQDAIVMAARIAGVQAIDGPLLTIAADEALEQAAKTAEALGFDGKWVIHPLQIGLVQRAFTPSDQERAEASAILEEMERAGRDGRGAVQWHGQMLDEAVAARARRVLARGVNPVAPATTEVDR